MSGTIRVTCGAAHDLVAGRSLSPAEIVTLRDNLSYGPLSELRDVEAWCAMRLAFWERVSREMENHESRRRRSGRAAVCDLVDRLERIVGAREVVLWVGMGLADQLTLAWMPQFLRAIGSPVETLRVVQFERTSIGALIPNLAYLLRTEIPRHPPPRPVDAAALAALGDAWSAVTADDPGRLLQFLDTGSVALPLLKSALRDILRRYPDAESGVNEFDA